MIGKEILIKASIITAFMAAGAIGIGLWYAWMPIVFVGIVLLVFYDEIMGYK